MYVFIQIKKIVSSIDKAYSGLWMQLKMYAEKCKRGYDMPYW